MHPLHNPHLKICEKRTIIATVCNAHKIYGKRVYFISVPQPAPDNQLYIPVLEYKQNPQNYGRSVIPGHIQIAPLPADIIRIGKFRIFSVDNSISGGPIHSPVLPVSIEFFQYYPLSFLTTSLPRQIFLIFQFSYISPI